MTTIEYIQLRAFARMDGALLSLLWTGSFACYVAGLSTPSLGMIAILLAMMTPFFVSRRLKNFRDGALDGIISFKRALAYSLLTFLYGSLLFAAVHFVYFSYMDHGYFFSMLAKMMSTPENIQALGKEMMTAVQQSLTAVAGMRPIDLALNIMMSNLFVGFILSLPLAAIMKRDVRKVKG